MRTILHSDLNNFYASVECVYRPEWKNVPLAVCGVAVYVLVQRIREINSGEEDDLDQY